jgi:hypothetical protein
MTLLLIAKNGDLLRVDIQQPSFDLEYYQMHDRRPAKLSTMDWAPCNTESIRTFQRRGTIARKDGSRLFDFFEEI